MMCWLFMVGCFACWSIHVNSMKSHEESFIFNPMFFIVPHSSECWVSISGSGVVRRFVSALKTGTEPWNLLLGCKAG